MKLNDCYRIKVDSEAFAIPILTAINDCYRTKVDSEAFTIPILTAKL